VSCNRPLAAWRTRAGELSFWNRGDGRFLELPCGKCLGCLQSRNRAWSIRIGHEAQLYEENSCATLTYDDKHLPRLASLDYSHFQDFMRRLRRELVGVTELPGRGRPIRFFVAGEYGAKNKRPHFHAILFNVRFPDLSMQKPGYFTSKKLDELWGKGACLIGSVSTETAAYVAGYTLDKVYGVSGVSHYESVDMTTGELLGDRRRPFVKMSNRPGIGAWWFERFGADLFPYDQAVQEGAAYKVPRYYWERFKRTADPGLVEALAYKRELKAAENPEESRPERRAVREEHARLRIQAFRKRPL